MPTDDHPTWSRITTGKFTSFVLPGDYNMLAVVTGRAWRWTWRIVDRDTGYVISDAGREHHGQPKTALRMAKLVMDANARRWGHNLREIVQHLEDRLEFERITALERGKMSEEVEFMRAMMRHTMIVERGGIKHATCDLCKQKPDHLGLQLHELMQRGMTVNNPAARELSYVPELTALLCANCHSRAHNPEVRDQLFRIAFKRYGRLQVSLAFERFKSAYEQRNTSLTIKLPTHVSGTFRETQQRAGTARARPPPGRTVHPPNGISPLS